MELASIVDQYSDGFMEKYGRTILPGMLSALRAIRRCRTPASGEFYVQGGGPHRLDSPIPELSSKKLVM